MRGRVGLLAVLVLAGCTLPAWADVNLSWKLAEGDTLYVETTLSQDVNMVTFGQRLKDKQTTVASLTVVKKNADGSLVLEEKVLKAKSGGDSPAGPFLEGVLKQVEGATVKVHLKPDFSFDRMEGVEAVVKKVSDNANLPPAFATQIRVVVSTLLARPIEQTFGYAMPGKVLKTGEKWSSQQRLPLGPIGFADVTNQFILDSETGGKAKIIVAPTMKFIPPEKGTGGIPLPVSKAEMKTESAKGEMLFDAAAGRLARLEQDLKIKGSLTISFMGQEMPLEIEMQLSTRSTVTDTAP